MATNIIIVNIEPAKERLESLLQEMRTMKLTLLGRNLITEQRQEEYENSKQVVKGYDITPETYEVSRRLLMEKCSELSTITKLLYNDIETAIERRLPRWILDKVHHQRNTDILWSVSRLGNFLGNLLDVNERSLSLGLSYNKPFKAVNVLF
ncbi:hypothetical protein LOAG_16484 [Loa loa]|uniref:Uncharacterized protein n=1 Tax=Loa loa TaxID=7209 RepID=A0A1S0UMI6_LOALO|nr:hypothetical protein LOAG_16484 [Loa loa]EJD76608.1 hypothetical protein LOAG_16484 [Loa loa]